MISVNTISTLADIQCCKNLQELYIRWALLKHMFEKHGMSLCAFQKESNPWHWRDSLAKGFAKIEKPVSFTFLCTLTPQEPTSPISYIQYIISAASWAAARSHQFLIPIHRWLEENPCAESVGPELYRQANKLRNENGKGKVDGYQKRRKVSQKGCFGEKWQ